MWSVQLNSFAYNKRQIFCFFAYANIFHTSHHASVPAFICVCYRITQLFRRISEWGTHFFFCTRSKHDDDGGGVAWTQFKWNLRYFLDIFHIVARGSCAQSYKIVRARWTCANTRSVFIVRCGTKPIQINVYRIVDVKYIQNKCALTKKNQT